MLWPWPGSLGQTHNHRCCKISLYRTAKMKTMNKWRLIVHHANSLGNHCASWMACRAFILGFYQKWDHLGYWEAIFCVNSVLFYIMIVSVHAFFNTLRILNTGTHSQEHLQKSCLCIFCHTCAVSQTCCVCCYNGIPWCNPRPPPTPIFYYFFFH